MDTANPTAEDTVLSLILDIAHGCQYKCSGCVIDKHAAVFPEDSVFDRMHVLLDSFEERGYGFNEIEIGPVDLLTCDNIEQILSSEKLSSLVQRFTLLTLPLGMILADPQVYVEFAKRINVFAKGCKVGLAIPTELNHILNNKYLGVIRRNIDAFKSALELELDESILTILFDTRFSVDNPLKKHTYADLFARALVVEVATNTKVDFGFQHGRVNLRDRAVGKSFIDAINTMNSYWVRSLMFNENIESKHVPYQIMFDLKGQELFYSGGKMYVRPILNERIAVTDPFVEFTKDWTFDGYWQAIEERTINSLTFASEVPDCTECAHIMTCANRGIHALMEITNQRKCISLLPMYTEDIEKIQRGAFHEIQWNKEKCLPTKTVISTSP